MELVSLPLLKNKPQCQTVASAEEATSANKANALDATDNEADPRECYVCCGDETDGAELLSICQCRGRFMHLSCEFELIRTCPSHGLRCPVCCVPYGNITARPAHPYVTAAGRAQILIMATNALLAVLGFHQLSYFSMRRRYVHLWFGLMFLAIAIASTLLVRRLGSKRWVLARSWATLHNGRGYPERTMLWPPVTPLSLPRVRPLSLWHRQSRVGHFGRHYSARRLTDNVDPPPTAATHAAPLPSQGNQDQPSQSYDVA